MTLGKSRLEAFSDGVLAIIITVMVLELRPPHGDSWASLRGMLPTFVSYVLSFVYVAIYWNNHHHLLHTAKRVNGKILWANTFLLFWLSLVPFVTGWMGENQFSARPLAAYGFVLLMAAIAYFNLSRLLIREHGPESPLRAAIGHDIKGRISIALYGAAMALSFISRWLGFAIYWIVALMWLVPDRRIEQIATVERAER